MSHLQVLDVELRSVQIKLPTTEKLQLAAYCDELARWNQKINLTGLSGVELVRRLVIEPLWIGLQLNPAGVLADIGSGNGSPAIPLQVVCKFQACHLIEARIKRAAFLRRVISAANVERTHVHRGRFEDVVGQLGPVDWVTLQGVALATQLIDSIRYISSATTTVVWVTTERTDRPMRPLKTIRVPFSDTEVLLFRLG